MGYVLSTTDTVVRWYSIPITSTDDIAHLKEGDFELLDQLDLARVPGFGTKETAKAVAKAIGLKTWRYVVIDTPNHTYTIKAK